MQELDLIKSIDTILSMDEFRLDNKYRATSLRHDLECLKQSIANKFNEAERQNELENMAYFEEYGY